MSIDAKFPGRCKCGARFPAGARIEYQKGGATACPSCQPALAPAADEPATETKALCLAVQVTAIKAKKESGWAAFRGRLLACPDAEADGVPVRQGTDFNISGRFGDLSTKIQTGASFDVLGTFHRHPQYGWQFTATQLVPTVKATLQGLEAFLQSLPGIGPATARRVIQACDNKQGAVLAALETPEGLQTLAAVRGITAERAAEIQAAYQEATDLREVQLYLAGKALPPALHAKALRTWGPKTKKILERDPYRLMELPGVGFAMADEAAKTKWDVALDDSRRLRAAVMHLLREQERQGHTWSPLEEFGGLPDTPFEPEPDLPPL